MFSQFNIILTEEDYLAFNRFHAFESTHGKKLVRKTRFFFTLAMVVLMALVLLILGWTTFSAIYTISLGIFTMLYMLLFKKIVNWNIKTQIKRLKEIGKLPFEPVSTIEFYEDKMVERTASKRSEQGYDTFERICIVKDRFILLYQSSVGAYILPIPQINEQANLTEIVNFLSQKCKNMEYYG